MRQEKAALVSYILISWQFTDGFYITKPTSPPPPLCFAEHTPIIMPLYRAKSNYLYLCKSQVCVVCCVLYVMRVTGPEDRNIILIVRIFKFV